MTVTFFGHSELCWDRISYIKSKLIEHLQILIHNGADEFLLGGYGKFDYICASVLLDLKKQYPHIRLVLVLAYMDKKYDIDIYDSSWYPPLEKVPKRYAIPRRNILMVDKSDVVVCYLDHSWGGASKAVNYAKSKNKNIIYLGGVN